MSSTNNNHNNVVSLEYPTPSTTDLSKEVLCAATAAAIPFVGSFAARTCDGIRDEEDWRWHYDEHAVRHVRVCADADGEGCVAVARAGLDKLYDRFTYGDGVSLRDALVTARTTRRARRSAGDDDASTTTPRHDSAFGTGRVVGTTARRSPTTTTDQDDHGRPDLRLPWHGRTLRGDAVHARMRAWVEKGVVEPDVARAIADLTTADTDLSDAPWVFVVMGAGAAMGPLRTLLELGAHVVALDLPIPRVWERLTTWAAASPGGSLTFPTTPGGGDVTTRAGCNLLNQIPEIIDWLSQVQPDRRLVLGSYAYLDGGAFVRVSLAMDAIASETLRERPDSALAYLCTPTDVFVVPPAARDMARENYVRDEQSFLQTFLTKILPHERILKQNVVADTRHKISISDHGRHDPMPIVDALILQQGPNYFLAKRLQHWRAMTCYYEGTALVSATVAPASYTHSVTKNKLLKAGFSQAHHFDPIEIFEPETSNVLMTWLLLHDLKRARPHDDDDDDPLSPSPPRRHPLRLFTTTPVHNGIWRCGYQIRSLLELALLYYSLERYRPQLLAAILAVVLGGAGVYTNSRL